MLVLKMKPNLHFPNTLRLSHKRENKNKNKKGINKQKTEKHPKPIHFHQSTIVRCVPDLHPPTAPLLGRLIRTVTLHSENPHDPEMEPT